MHPWNTAVTAVTFLKHNCPIFGTELPLLGTQPSHLWHTTCWPRGEGSNYNSVTILNYNTVTVLI